MEPAGQLKIVDMNLIDAAVPGIVQSVLDNVRTCEYLEQERVDLAIFMVLNASEIRFLLEPTKQSSSKIRDHS